MPALAKVAQASQLLLALQALQEPLEILPEPLEILPEPLGMLPEPLGMLPVPLEKLQKQEQCSPTQQLQPLHINAAAQGP